jgi:hypothetical protein
MADIISIVEDMGDCGRCLYDTSEKEFRVRSIELRKEKQHDCPEGKI